MFLRRSAIATVMLLCLASSAEAQWVWDGETGWTDLNVSPERSPQGLYAYARALAVRGDYAAAEEVYLQVQQGFADSEWTDKAIFGRAECLERLGKLEDALDLDDGLLARKTASVPDTRIIAHKVITLRKLALRRPQRAADSLAEIARTAPSPALRQEARIAEAETRFANGDYEGARLAWDSVAGTATEKETANHALFQSGLADFAACRETGHDQERLERAAKGFREYVMRIGEGAEADRARLYLWVIDSVLHEDEVLCRPVYYAVSYVPEGRYGEAWPLLKRGADKFRRSRAGETARFFQAECLFLQEEYWDAFKMYERFLKEYPATVRLRDAVAREFTVGRILRDQGKGGKALIVFGRVVDNIPGGALADDALMHEGFCYLDDKRYADARMSFDQVVSAYPQSEWYYAAVFNGGKADLFDTDFRNDDDAALARAQRSFEVYLKHQPTGASAGAARALLKTCREKQSQALAEVASFYERRQQPLAAAMYYRALVREDAQGAWADKARARLQEYEKEGLTLP